MTKNRYVAEDDDDNKVANIITLGNNCLLGAGIIENDDVRKSEKDSSLYFYNRKYNQSDRHDERAKINKTNIVYYAQNDRLIAQADINKAISEKGYNKQALTPKLFILSEEHKDNVQEKRVKIEKKQTYNVTRDNVDVVTKTSQEVGFPNSAAGSKIIQEDDTESDEAIKKYVVENIVVGNQRGTKNNSKIASTAKSICTYKIQTDIIQKKISSRKKY